MKKMGFAGLTATVLALTALSSQRAAAQYPPECQRGGEVSFNVGVSFGCHWTPCHGHWAPNCPPPSCGYPPVQAYGYPPAYGYAPVGYPGAAFAAPQPATASAPSAPAAPNGPAAAPATSSAAQTELKNIGYEYAAPYGYDYGYGYGNPYDPVMGYWYER